MLNRTFAILVCLAVLGGIGFESPTLAGGKKDKTPDHHGVIVEVHRDNDKNDKDIGYIVVKTPKNNVKVVVMKSTDIRRDTADVAFKGLDKGDVVLVWMKNGAQHAEKIVIRKN